MSAFCSSSKVGSSSISFAIAPVSLTSSARFSAEIASPNTGCGRSGRGSGSALPDGVRTSPVAMPSIRVMPTTSPACAEASFSCCAPISRNTPATRVPFSTMPSLTAPRQIRASDSLPVCGRW